MKTVTSFGVVQMYDNPPWPLPATFFRKTKEGWEHQTRSERGLITYSAVFDADGNFIRQREYWPSARRPSYTNYFTAERIIELSDKLKSLLAKHLSNE